jgi:hypothetical protein
MYDHAAMIAYNQVFMQPLADEHLGDRWWVAPRRDASSSRRMDRYNG